MIAEKYVAYLVAQLESAEAEDLNTAILAFSGICHPSVI